MHKLCACLCFVLFFREHVHPLRADTIGRKCTYTMTTFRSGWCLGMFPHLSRSYTCPVQVAYLQVCTSGVEVVPEHAKTYTCHTCACLLHRAWKIYTFIKKKGVPGRGVCNAHFWAGWERLPPQPNYILDLLAAWIYSLLQTRIFVKSTFWR